MDKLVALKPEVGQDLIERLDEIGGMVSVLYKVTDNLASVADEAPSQQTKRVVSSTLYMMTVYVQQLSIELDGVCAAILQRETKGGAKK